MIVMIVHSLLMLFGVGSHITCGVDEIHTRFPKKPGKIVKIHDFSLILKFPSKSINFNFGHALMDEFFFVVDTVVYYTRSPGFSRWGGLFSDVVVKDRPAPGNPNDDPGISRV